MLNKLVLAALAFLALSNIAAARDITFQGEVTYRERLALPASAELWVSLVAMPGGDPLASAAARILQSGQVPLQFTLNVRSSVIDNGGAYGLVAEIRVGQRTLFRSVQPVPVDVLAPAPTMIVVSFSPHPPRDPPVEELLSDEPPSPLLDTAWTVTSIGGSPVLPETRVSFAISPDRGAGGHGGCNKYFAEASFEGVSFSLGPVAGTRMACAPEVMAQEAAFFAALVATAGYRQTGETLQLLDAAGIALVGLVRAP